MPQHRTHRPPAHAARRMRTRGPLALARRLAHGFTLVELMVVVAIVALLSAVAVPSYFSYVKRSRVPAGLDALQAYATRMEQRYQDVGAYSCLTLPSANLYSFACTLSGGGTGYTATATGSGQLAGYAYTINHNGVRATTAHPNGSNGSCWTIRGSTCDV